MYLPAHSELHVSMWRLTDGKRVWYEWCAEGYLEGETKASRRLSAKASSSPLLNAPPSPIADAVETVIHGQVEAGRSKIKIGQTGLHNVGGRSSWIGL